MTGARSWWSVFAQWRNWRLPVKVAAVLAVPAIAAVTLGAVQIHGDITNASTYTRIQHLVSLRAALVPLATDLQDERLLAAQKLGTKTVISIPDYYTLNNKVDQDALNVTNIGNTLLDPNTAAGIRYQGLTSQLDNLGTLHQQALNGDADAVTVISNYSGVISAILDLDEALSTQLGNAALTGTATAMTDLEVAREQVRQQQAIVDVIISRGQLQDVELATLSSSDGLLADRLEDFQVVATPAELARYQQAPVVSSVNAREAFAQTVLSNGQTLLEIGNPTNSTTSIGVSGAAWTTASNTAATQLADVLNRLSGQLTSTSATLRYQATDAAGIEAAIVIAVLLLAVLVGVVIGRHLLRSLNILRRTALDVAEHRLPEMVASIEGGNLEGLDIPPVPVHTNEDLGQLARAFDAVHAQAVESAVGQANLRANLRNVFINLSRRSQSLVERQLRLMERLERNEEDPQQLANLFRLDHLATRMRRNNENLMVLSGDDPARRSGHPLPLADVLRAAVSEIEQYQRVVVRSTPSVDVLGYASGDLVRLIAELLDNATSFSPPKTLVRIGGQSSPDGSVHIEIRDEGIGMAGPELADANDRLTSTTTEDVPVSRQMGLYVVGRLGRRHSIDVSLEVVPEGGLLATVRVPAELVRPGTGPARPTDSGAVNGAVNGVVSGHAVNGHGTNGNGSNGNGTNGHTTNGLLPVFGAMEQPAPVAPLAPATEPEWGSFAGGIGDTVINLTPSGFTWFNTKRPDQPAAPVPEQPAPGPASFTSVGLPRRVPRTHAVPSLVPPGSHRSGPVRPRADVSGQHAGQYGAGQHGSGQHSSGQHGATGAEPAHRNPARARGFLNDYQAGIRQGQPGPGADSANGADRPDGADRADNGQGEAGRR
ncbi:MAG TPA: nitrate- and nitrite sensing domain-containing protein [Pseudonocardiaceae bacterium]|nr:nitrate- and nitrite sensing domain-containing protein [Pseudonocardiaceae bacterium]